MISHDLENELTTTKHLPTENKKGLNLQLFYIFSYRTTQKIMKYFINQVI